MSRYRLLINGCSCIGKRSVQQDSFGFTDSAKLGSKGVLAVLSDGIGGMDRGEIYSRSAVDAMLRSFDEVGNTSDICKVLLELYGVARRETRRLLEDRDVPDGGATLVAVLVRNNECAFLSVGDSSLYLLRKGGLIRLNRPQTLGISLDEAAALGYVPSDEARYNRYRNALANHVCEADMGICDRNLMPMRLRAGDRLMLMSDGVTSVFSQQEIAGYMRMKGAKGSSAMIDEISMRDEPRQDNATAIMLTLIKPKPLRDRGA